MHCSLVCKYERVKRTFGVEETQKLWGSLKTPWHPPSNLNVVLQWSCLVCYIYCTPFFSLLFLHLRPLVPSSCPFPISFFISLFPPMYCSRFYIDFALDIMQSNNLSPFLRNNIQNWVQKNTVLLHRRRNYNRPYSTFQITYRLSRRKYS